MKFPICSLMLALFLFSLVGKAQNAAQPVVLPQFSFAELSGGKAITNADLPRSAKKVFIFYDPGCGHCQEEAEAIGKNLDKFEGVHFYFISMQDKPLIEEYVRKYGKRLVNQKQVKFLHDSKYEFVGKFHPKQFPSLYVYSADNRLLGYADGPKKISDILKLVNR